MIKIESKLLEIITGNFKLTEKIYGNFPLIIYTIIFAVILILIIRYTQHRKLVIIYEKIKNGYVRTSDRYSDSIDRNNGLEYLRPIFGKNRLPSFPSKFWQKTKGMPIFGVNRILNIIKLNNHTYKPIVPNYNTGECDIIDYSNLSWVYMNEYKKFITNRKKGDMVYLLSVLAPSAIIIACVAFFIFAMLGQAGIERAAAEKITRATEVIINYASSK